MAFLNAAEGSIATTVTRSRQAWLRAVNQPSTAALSRPSTTPRTWPQRVFLALVGGLAIGESPVDLASYFGKSFWGLVPFTMQMAMVVIGGYVVASCPPVYRLIQLLAGVPRTSRQAVAFVALLSMSSSLISWGLSLVFTGILVREICGRLPKVDYRAIGAAAYLGLGAVWALGISSSAAQLQANKGSLPSSILSITGVIPFTETIFLWQSGFMLLVLVVISLIIAYVTAPGDASARDAAGGSGQRGRRVSTLVCQRTCDGDAGAAL